MATRFGNFAKKAAQTLKEPVKEAGVCFGLACGCKYAQVKYNEQFLNPAPKKIENFAREQLACIGLTDPTIKIKVDPRLNGTYAKVMPGDTIILGNSELGELLKKSHLTSQEKESLNAFKAIIQHEGTHVKEKHFQKGLGMLFLAPLCADFVCAAIKKGSGRVFRSQKLAQRLYIPTWIGTAYSSIWIYANHTEKKADGGIQNKVEILRAAAHDFKKHGTDTQKALKQGGLAGMLSWARYTTDPHPDSLKRAERLEERIDHLQKKSS